MEAPGRIVYPLHEARWILRSLASLSLLLSLCLYIADGVTCVNEVNAYNNEFGFIEDAGVACWTDPLVGDLRPLLIVVAAMVWNIAEFITLCVNRKGIHPGAHIGLDNLLFWALLSAAAISFYNIAQSGESPALGKYTAAAVFDVLAAIFHLTLFILDAISVHKYRRTTFGDGFYNSQPTAYPPTSAQPVAYQQAEGPYASLPPPPPGMAYLVPLVGAAGSYPAGVQTVPLPKNATEGLAQPEPSVVR